MAGPGVPGALGSANQEDRIGIGGEDNSHCGPNQGGIVTGVLPGSGQKIAQSCQPAVQCE